MNKDRFELEIGKQLRDAHVGVPPGAWNVIQAQLQIQGASGASSGFGFGAALVAGSLLLAGLASYSALKVADEGNAVSDKQLFVVQEGDLTDGGDAPAGDASVMYVPEEETAPSEIDVNVHALSVSNDSESDGYRNVQLTADATTGEIDPREYQELPQSTISRVEHIPVVEMNNATAYEPEMPSPAIITGGLPDDIPMETAPFAASIRTSGSFGYAPFKVDFETVGNPSGQVWDFGPYGKSTDLHPTVVFDKPGLYSVMLSAYRGENEQKIEFVTIEVEEGSSLFVPNSFTPDGDGQNDVFLAKGTKLETYQLTIVNSKGSVVFQSLDIDEHWAFDRAVHGQDGEFYIAVVRARGLDGKEYNIRHRLNIIY